MNGIRQIAVPPTPPEADADALPPGGADAAELDRLYERVLVLRCQTGDEAALAELIGRYQRRLDYFVRRMLGVAGDADDLTQDIWLDVFRGIARLRQPDAFAPWLYRIARSRVYRQLRRRRRLITATGDPPDVADAPEPPELSFDETDVARLHAALEQLPHDQREAVTLRFLEGMSYEEIAAATDAKVGTVRSRLHYGRAALKRILERNPP